MFLLSLQLWTRHPNRSRLIDDHYKIDLTARKGAIKIMIQEELTKLSEQEDDDQDNNADAKKKQSRHRAKVTG